MGTRVNLSILGGSEKGGPWNFSMTNLLSLNIFRTFLKNKKRQLGNWAIGDFDGKSSSFGNIRKLTRGEFHIPIRNKAWINTDKILKIENSTFIKWRACSSWSLFLNAFYRIVKDFQLSVFLRRELNVEERIRERDGSCE